MYGMDTGGAGDIVLNALNAGLECVREIQINRQINDATESAWYWHDQAQTLSRKFQVLYNATQGFIREAAEWEVRARNAESNYEHARETILKMDNLIKTLQAGLKAINNHYEASSQKNTELEASIEAYKAKIEEWRVYAENVRKNRDDTIRQLRLEVLALKRQLDGPDSMECEKRRSEFNQELAQTFFSPPKVHIEIEQ